MIVNDFLKEIRFYFRWIYFKIMLGFLIRSVRRCRLIDKMFFDPHIDYDMGYFVVECMMRDVIKSRKFRNKTKKYLDKIKGDGA